LRLLARAITIAAVAAGIGLGVNALRPSGLRIGKFEPPASCDGAEAAGTPFELDAAQVATLCGAPEVVVADARPASRFAEGHVAGAIHLPCDASGPVASEALARIEGKRTVVVYGETTDDAQPVAASLRRRIHRPDVHIAVLRGGFQAWSQGGQACASGPCDECGEDHVKEASHP
jgi:rhodanese-related sulfurtransferase